MTTIISIVLVYLVYWFLSKPKIKSPQFSSGDVATAFRVERRPR